MEAVHIPVGIRTTGVLECADGFAWSCLAKGRRQRDLIVWLE